MDSKKILTLGAFVVLLAFVGACSSTKKIDPPQTHAVEEASEEAEAARESLPPPVSTETMLPVPPEAALAPAPAIPAEAPKAPERKFGIWIDAAGFDGLRALGFLQELEKKGVKPAQILGTGFGCWVAMSWASENSGNSAEWQSFKWQDLKSIESSGLLGKLISPAAKQDFLKEFDRLTPLKAVNAGKVPVDCPLFSKEGSEGLRSAKGLPLGEVFWSQIHLPGLGADPDSSSSLYYSGTLALRPKTSELLELQDPTVTDWIILRTRSNRDLSPNSKWIEVLGIRWSNTPDSSNKITSYVAALAPSDKSDGFKDPAQRRRFLVEGRASAQQIFSQEAWRQFFGESETGPRPSP